MLVLNELTYRIEGKPILERATASIPTGHKVGLVGRNGAGKSTLLKLITGELTPDDGTIVTAKGARIGHVAQEAPGGPESILEWVLSADRERTALLEEAETATEPGRIADIQMRLSDIGAHGAPSRAAAILAGLGFDTAAQARPCGAFSGGWRMRIALAAILFLEPDVLLLDEPTNYLDLEGTLWLETYLKSYPHTVLMVSHDRDLLNRIPGAILHLDRGRLSLSSGGYDDFEEARREQQCLQLKLKKRQDEERRRIQAFIDRFKAKATKARQAQSRIKVLEKMQPIAAEVDQRVAPFHLPNPERRLASPLIRFEDAAVGYTDAKPVLTRINLRLDQDDRIALLGQNGNGKSTFAKLVSGKLGLITGQRFADSRVSVGYFAQHQLDELNPLRTPYETIVGLMPDATEAQRRARLGAIGFGADKADTRCQHLSGGEKARLLLAIAAFHGPHILILDEPTNHLDIDSREALIHALSEYEGAVILISHDRHLVEATAERLWIVKGGTVAPYDGDMESYRADLLAERGAAQGRSKSGEQLAPDARTDRVTQRRAAAQKRQQLAPLKKAMQDAERLIDRLGESLQALDARLADAALYAEPQKAQEASLERGLVARRLAEAEEAWLAATAAYEEAEREASENAAL